MPFPLKIRHRIALLLLIPVCAWIAWINFPRPAYRATPVDVQPVSDADTENDPAKALPFQVGVVYSPGYLINVGGLEQMHPFDIKKYQRIHDKLVNSGTLTNAQTLVPAALTDEDLLLVHSPAYLDALKSRSNVAKYLEAPILNFAPVSLDTGILQPFRMASGGTRLAARQALVSGIGINLGGGYHHAKPNLGEGFCLFADVPIAIRSLQKEGLIKRAVVIDVDVHQGNGTVLCLANDDATFTFSMHQKGIYPMPKEIGDLDVELPAGMDDVAYLAKLTEVLPKVLDDADADICFIVGGCDTLKGDPLASLKMTHQGIVDRDQLIVDECIKRKLPVVLTLSGGYSQDAWKAQYASVKNLIDRQTVAPNDPDSDQTESLK